MSVALTNCITAGYVDLATYDELETYLYGGSDAIAHFVRATRKCNWFTQVPCQLTQLNGQVGFNQSWGAKVSRGGDYMIHNWLRLRLSAVASTSAASSAGLVPRWCHNFMHNIVQLCTISFNDIVESKFDNYFLDFWAAFTVPAGKQVGYGNMIGNVDPLVTPYTGAAAVGTGIVTLPERVLNLPLPFPHTRDTGLALPTAALPYNEIAINIQFRDWTQLLMITDVTTGTSRNATAADVGVNIAATPTITEGAVWANYAVVSNDERKKMGKAPRDMIIEQAQLLNGNTSAGYVWNTPATQQTISVDLKYSQAVKVLFFGVRNTTVSNDWSNYTTRRALFTGGVGVTFPPVDGYDPIAQAALSYENTQRLPSIPIDYYSLINPWYHAINIPQVTGYHCYSYSMWFADLTPKGSTNYSKLNNVSMYFTASQDAIYGSQNLSATGGSTGLSSGETYEVVNNCLNHNVIRVSGGACEIFPRAQTVSC